MKRFEVIVTRDTTESTVVAVRAKNAAAAREKAFDKVLNDEGSLVWEQDDTPNASSDPYITGCEEV